ncbi:MAG: aspartate--tRNA ligase [Candidatus Omnitrophica bacterium]|nr:aspartate--tRNA ligase [Candidatus Omnitrophota bacterium]
MMRTATCGQLDVKALDREAALTGWVDTYRDHGDIIFIDLRDRWGVTQVVFDRKHKEQIHEQSKALRCEFVIRVKGFVKKRPPGTVNAKIPTGEIEMLADSLEILNTCPTPPFELGEKNVNEEIRLKYRFLDLRRKDMIEALTFRYKITKVVRDFLDKHEFLEIETPYLTRSTPEGARDFLVPSRLTQGSFYALPQSPQLFKQLLMVSGYERYFQLARCFRDEDLRKDRQPEHTQIDLEMSFVDEEDVMGIVEKMVADVFKKLLNRDLQAPFLRLTYEEAMNRFGSDKPDMRYEMELKDLNDVFKGGSFKIFNECMDKGGKIRGLCFTPATGQELSRKDFDTLTQWIGGFGAKGLAWMKVKDASSVDSPIAKFFDVERTTKLISTVKGQAGDVIFMVASDERTSAVALGALRVHLAELYFHLPTNDFKILWVKDFPLLEWNEDEKRFHAAHHPFTAPRPEDITLLETDPGKVRSLAYDLVLNGSEIGGGSIRIHRKDLQEKVFKVLGISAEEAQDKFGFLLSALSYGAPPHGGLAMGLDRFTANLLGRESIRDVIAFPKTQKGTCLMTEAPSPVADKQLNELGIQLKKQ